MLGLLIWTLLDWRFYATLLTLYIVSFYVRVFFRKLPPGPIPLPFLGNALQVGKQAHISLTKMKSKYGDVMTMYVGPTPVIVLQAESTIKQALVKNSHATVNRPRLMLFEKINEGYGIAGINGPRWKEHRQFSMSVLKDFGMGKSILQGHIQQECNVLINELKKSNARPLDLKLFIGPAVSNIICSLVFGQRFEYDDPAFVKNLQYMNDNVSAVGFSSIVDQIPWLRFLPGDLFNFHAVLRRVHYTKAWIQAQTDAHRANFKDDEITSLIDAYLKKEKDDGDKADKSFTDKQLQNTTADLFVAGSETTATSLLWCVVFLLHHPEIQSKLHKEIDEVMGTARSPEWSDKNKMPYSEAFMLEVQRFATIVPLGLPHLTTESFEVEGHRIPANTMLLTNLWAVHYNTNHWSEPNRFDPERFLDTDNRLKRPSSFLPFSTGPRVCLGESLARMELFFFLTSLLQTFRFENPQETPLPSLDGQLGATLSPHPYKVMVVNRF